MKKKYGRVLKRAFLLFTLFTAVMLFASCANFMTGEKQKEALEKEVEYAKAAPVTPVVQAKPGQGTAYTDVTVIKLGYPFNVSFEPNTSVASFRRWVAYQNYDKENQVKLDESVVEFSDPDKLETSVTIKQPLTNIRILPYCVSYPSITFRNPVCGDNRNAGSISPFGTFTETVDEWFSVTIACNDLYAFAPQSDSMPVGRFTVFDQSGKEVPDFSNLFEIDAESYQISDDLSSVQVKMKVLENEDIDVSGYSISAVLEKRPEITYAIPSTGATDIFRSFPVRLYFSKEMDWNSFELSDSGFPEKVTITCLDSPSDQITEVNKNSGLRYFARPSMDERTNKYIKFASKSKTENDWIPANTFVVVTVSGDVKDINGIPLGKDFVLRYTTGKQGDAYGPDIKNPVFKYKSSSTETSLSTEQLWDETSSNSIVILNPGAGFTMKNGETGGLGENQFKLSYSAEDSSGIDKMYVTERLLYVPEGVRIPDSGGTYRTAPQGGWRLFEFSTAKAIDSWNGNKLTFTDASGNICYFSREDFEIQKEIHQSLVNISTAANSGDPNAASVPTAATEAGWNVGLMYDGIHGFELSATDKLDQLSESPAPFFVSVDTTAPSLSQLATSNLTEAGSVSLIGTLHCYNAENRTISFSAVQKVMDNGSISTPRSTDGIAYWKIALSDYSWQIPEAEAWSEYKDTDEEIQVEMPESTFDREYYVWFRLKDSIGNESVPYCLDDFKALLDVTKPAVPYCVDSDSAVSHTVDSSAFIYIKGASADVTIKSSGDGSIGSGITAFTSNAAAASPTWLETSGNSRTFSLAKDTSYAFAMKDLVNNVSGTYAVTVKKDSSAPELEVKVEDSDYEAENYVMNDSGSVRLTITVHDKGAGLADGGITVSGLKRITSCTLGGANVACTSGVISTSARDNKERTYIVTGELDAYQGALNATKQYTVSVSAKDYFNNTPASVSKTVRYSKIPTVTASSFENCDPVISGFSRDGDVSFYFTAQDTDTAFGLGSIEFENFTMSAYKTSSTGSWTSATRIPVTAGTTSILKYYVKGKVTTPSKGYVIVKAYKNTVDLCGKKTLNFTYDATAPSITITEYRGVASSKNGYTNSAGGTNSNMLTFTVSDPAGLKANSISFENFTVQSYKIGSASSFTTGQTVPVSAGTTSITVTVRGAFPSTTYSPKIYAEDRLGNKYSSGNGVTKSFILDTAAPTQSSTKLCDITNESLTEFTTGTVALNLYKFVDSGSGLESVTVSGMNITAYYRTTGTSNLPSSWTSCSSTTSVPAAALFTNGSSGTTYNDIWVKGTLTATSNGEASVVIIRKDRAGNSTQETKRIVKDTTAPSYSNVYLYDESSKSSSYSNGDLALRLYGYTDGSGIGLDSITVSGMSITGYSTANSSSMPTSWSTISSTSTVPDSALYSSGSTLRTNIWVKGTYTGSNGTVRVTASDKLGNSNYVDRTIIVDTVKPNKPNIIVYDYSDYIATSDFNLAKGKSNGDFLIKMYNTSYLKDTGGSGLSYIQLSNAKITGYYVSESSPSSISFTSVTPTAEVPNQVINTLNGSNKTTVWLQATADGSDNSTYTVTATAYDYAGNSQYGTASLKLDKTRPHLSYTSITDGTQLYSYSVSPSGNNYIYAKKDNKYSYIYYDYYIEIDRASNKDSIKLSGMDAYDGSGVGADTSVPLRWERYLDKGTYWEYKAGGSFTNYGTHSENWNYSYKTSGDSYIYVFYMKDTLGNEGTTYLRIDQ